MFTLRRLELLRLLPPLLLGAVAPGIAAGIFDNLPEIQPRLVTYKTVGTQELKLFVYAPPAADAGKVVSRPAVVFIHGGGWGAGKPDLFFPHCRYFAARGWVAIAVQYRLTAQPGVTVFECVADVKSAMRWMRAHAAELGIDPQKIAVAGDSAGGHLAAALGLLPGLDDPADDLKVSARPDAMILYNPVIDLTPPDGWRHLDPKLKPRAAELSPMDHVTAGAAPTLLIHGTADDVTPYEWAVRFNDVMKKAGNKIQFETLQGKKHAFIIPGYGDEDSIRKSVEWTEAFLRDLWPAVTPK